MKVYIACIDHRHGQNRYLATTEKRLIAQVAAFCRDWWDEVEAKAGARPKSDWAVIKRYFAAQEDEFWEYGCEDLKLPLAVIAALQHSTTQLKDLANGWPQRELHEPLATTIKRNEKLLKREGVRLDE
jgi:hypothetical protein